MQQSIFMFIIKNEHKPNFAIYFLQTPMQFPSIAKNSLHLVSNVRNYIFTYETIYTYEKSALQQIIPVHLIHTKNSIFVQKYLHSEL